MDVYFAFVDAGTIAEKDLAKGEEGPVLPFRTLGGDSGRGVDNGDRGRSGDLLLLTFFEGGLLMAKVLIDRCDF